MLLYFLPLFHIVLLQAARQQSSAAAFNATTFVEKFWDERLLKATGQAVDAKTLLAAIGQNREAARKKFGHSPGLGGSYYYFVAGTGHVLSAKDDEIAFALAANGKTPDVIVETGPVFGNAIRDGSGLLNGSDFANSEDFNSISSEINRRVEERVLPLLRKSAVAGAKIHFVGFVEMKDETGDVRPLRLVPITVEAL